MAENKVFRLRKGYFQNSKQGQNKRSTISKPYFWKRSKTSPPLVPNFVQCCTEESG